MKRFRFWGIFVVYFWPMLVLGVSMMLLNLAADAAEWITGLLKRWALNVETVAVRISEHGDKLAEKKP